MGMQFRVLMRLLIRRFLSIEALRTVILREVRFSSDPPFSRWKEGHKSRSPFEWCSEFMPFVFANLQERVLYCGLFCTIMLL